MYPHLPQATLSPWSAMNTPSPQRAQIWFFQTILSPSTSYKSDFLTILITYSSSASSSAGSSSGSAFLAKTCSVSMYFKSSTVA